MARTPRRPPGCDAARRRHALAAAFATNAGITSRAPRAPPRNANSAFANPGTIYGTRLTGFNRRHALRRSSYLGRLNGRAYSDARWRRSMSQRVHGR